MAFSNNGNNFTPPRPVSSPSVGFGGANVPNYQSLLATTANGGNQVTAPKFPSAPTPAANTSAPANPAPFNPGAQNQNTINSILDNNSLTPQQKQQQIQAAGLGVMPIIYGNQSGSQAGTIAGGQAPTPQFTPQFSDQISKLYGANPLNLLGGNVSNMSQAMNQINSNRAALGSNFLNNNGMGAAGTFSPVVTGQNFQSQASPLSSLLNYLNVLGASRNNNYTS